MPFPQRSIIGCWTATARVLLAPQDRTQSETFKQYTPCIAVQVYDETMNACSLPEDWRWMMAWSNQDLSARSSSLGIQRRTSSSAIAFVRALQILGDQKAKRADKSFGCCQSVNEIWAIASDDEGYQLFPFVIVFFLFSRLISGLRPIPPWWRTGRLLGEGCEHSLDVD